MKRAVAALVWLVIASGASASEDGKVWLSPLQIEMSEDSGAQVPEVDSCEVPEARRGIALSRLRSKALIGLTQAEATNLVADCFVVGKGKTPYLVRAVYGHRRTGNYWVRRVGNDLLVAHGSLGHYSTYTKSALVVNLPFKPRHVGIKVDIDE